MKTRQRISVIALVIALFLTSGCSGPIGRSATPGDPAELHVAAASDLRFAFEELGARFEEEHGVKVIFQFGSSGNLAQQIAGGAPLDLFASANRHFVDELVASGDILEDTVALYAIGRIVLAVNRSSGLSVSGLEDLLRDEIDVIALANPDHAPYGLAGRQALETAGIWDTIRDKLVYGENVSQAMQFVQTGNAPLGIIALSIANVDELDYILIDDSLHQPLEQQLGVVSHSNNKELAQTFGQFVNSPDGRIVMESYGFIIP